VLLKAINRGILKNSRAIRGVNKTLGQLIDVMTKIYRTLKRMGEEHQREHKRRREESQSELHVWHADENRKE
jgi:hypothetical protein